MPRRGASSGRRGRVEKLESQHSMEAHRTSPMLPHHRECPVRVQREINNLSMAILAMATTESVQDSGASSKISDIISRVPSYPVQSQRLPGSHRRRPQLVVYLLIALMCSETQFDRVGARAAGVTVVSTCVDLSGWQIQSYSLFGLEGYQQPTFRGVVYRQYFFRAVWRCE